MSETKVVRMGEVVCKCPECGKPAVYYACPNIAQCTNEECDCGENGTQLIVGWKDDTIEGEGE
jgi:hypothetical protein